MWWKEKKEEEKREERGGGGVIVDGWRTRELRWASFAAGLVCRASANLRSRPLVRLDPEPVFYRTAMVCAVMILSMNT